MKLFGSHLSLLSLLLASPAVAQDRLVDVTLTEGTNMAAALSPDRQTLAIDLIGRIWVMPANGGSATPITDEFGDARQPAWSPDGRRVAFQSFRDGNYHIWSVSADGTDLTQHTFGPYDDREPDWTTDGRQLVFSSDRSGNYDLWRIDLRTGTLAQMTTDPADDYNPAVHSSGRIVFVSEREAGRGIWVRNTSGSEELYAGVRGRVSAPSWRPDGGAVSYTAMGFGETSLVVVEAGQSPRTISDSGQDIFPFRAVWLDDFWLLYTGDGRILRRAVGGDSRAPIQFTAEVSFTRHAYERAARDFASTDPRPVRGIVSPMVSPVDPDLVAFIALGDMWTQHGDDLVQVTSDAYLEFNPAWAPDGRKLVYASDRSGALQLWVWDSETGESEQLTDGPGGVGAPVWSPDGSTIVYQLSVGLATEMRLIDVGTGQDRTLRDDLFLPGRPSWSPDGRILAFSALRQYSGRFREGRNEILYMSLDGEPDRWTTPTLHRSVGTRGLDGPVWSPDGHRMAYVGDGLLWVVHVTPTGEIIGTPVRLSSELAGAISWTGDSRFVVYQVTDGIRRVDVLTGADEGLPSFPWGWVVRHPSSDRRVVIHAGRMWDGMADHERTNVDVVIEGSRIVAVEDHRDALHRDSVIDAGDQTLMPGLADAHAHVGYGAGEALGRVWLAFGITSIRNPSADPFMVRERRESVGMGIRVGPREFATGRIMDGTRIYYSDAGQLSSGVQVGQEIERAAELKYDLVKTYVRMSDLMQKRVIDAAHANGIPVSSHELYPAVAFGADHVEHIRGTSRRGYSTKISALSRSYQDVVALLVASGMTLTPTMGLQGGFWYLVGRDPSILDDPRVLAIYTQEYVDRLTQMSAARGGGASSDGMPGSLVAQGETIKRVVSGGGRVIAGTDSPIIPYGLSLHTELQNYVDGGLTPVEALRSATSVFADAVGAGDLGTIAPGMFADMVIVDGNPLEEITDTRRVRIVVKNGDVFTLEQLLAGPISPRGLISVLP